MDISLKQVPYTQNQEAALFKIEETLEEAFPIRAEVKQGCSLSLIFLQFQKWKGVNIGKSEVKLSLCKLCDGLLRAGILNQEVMDHFGSLVKPMNPFSEYF